MKIIDISWPITPDITGYKDKKTVVISHIKQFDHDHVRESVVTMGSHTGTHIDAPSHFLKNGSNVDQLPLEQLIGRCIVIDCTQVEEKIDAQFLQQHALVLKQYSIVLFKTRNSLRLSTEVFDYTFIYIDASGAEYLSSMKLQVVGIDYLGIERAQPNHQTHTLLMNANTIIIEGLRLQSVEPGEYTFICLPIHVIGVEAAPARAVLLSPSIFIGD